MKLTPTRTLEDAAAWLNTNGTLGIAWVWNKGCRVLHVYPNRYLVKIGRHAVVMDTNEFNEVFR